MFRKSLAVLPVVAALLLGSSLCSKAQSYTSLSQVGTVTQDNANYMSLSVRASSYNAGDPTIPIQISGQINMAGYTGNLGMNVGAPVKSIVLDTTIINKLPYKRIVLASKPFQYVDLNSGNTTFAVMRATVVQYKRGMIAFQIVDASTGVTLAATATSDGEIALVPLASGSTNIFSF